MNNKALGIWYVEIPSESVINPLGKIVEPKFHHGSYYVVIDRKPKIISGLPKLTTERIKEFAEVFC